MPKDSDSSPTFKSKFDVLQSIGNPTFSGRFFRSRRRLTVVEPAKMFVCLATSSCAFSKTFFEFLVMLAQLAFYRQSAEDGHKHVHVFLKMTKPYVAAGRYQTEEQAKEVVAGVRRMLNDLRFPVIECGTDEESLKELLKQAWVAGS